MKKFYIADTHFSDNNIFTYYNRPFTDIDEMDNAIIERWNSVVGHEDTVYLLGDIGNVDKLQECNGRIVVVLGNHDRNNETITKLEQFMYDRFLEIRDKDEKGYEGVVAIYDYPVMDNEIGAWLSHEPIEYMPPQVPYLNIHGHTHTYNYNPGSLSWKDGNRAFNVSAENINYTPISLEGIVKAVGYGE